MKKVLVIDNYDSFTYNLVHYLLMLKAQVDVIRNDDLTLKQACSKVKQYTHLLISPGPCTPNESGISLDIIQQVDISILGVCLGHQCIGQAYGGHIVRAPKIMHGKVSSINHSGEGVFRDLSHPLIVARYHSLIIDAETIPSCLEVTAEIDGVIMGVKHRDLPIEGVQFHPESIASKQGMELLENFLKS